MMWGSDSRHTESTWPDSLGAVTAAVAAVPESESRWMLGLNAVGFYGFDVDLLLPVAGRIGPRQAS
jgi:hypothetical protein